MQIETLLWLPTSSSPGPTLLHLGREPILDHDIGMVLFEILFECLFDNYDIFIIFKRFVECCHQQIWRPPRDKGNHGMESVILRCSHSHSRGLTASPTFFGAYIPAPPTPKAERTDAKHRLLWGLSLSTPIMARC
jgi:hypothetical protein